MITTLLFAATVLALISTGAFIIVYATHAHWWNDPLGRMLMLGGISVFSLCAVGTLRRIDFYLDSVVITQRLEIGSVLGYLFVAVVWAYKTYVVVRETKNLRGDDDDE